MVTILINLLLQYDMIQFRADPMKLNLNLNVSLGLFHHISRLLKMLGLKYFRFFSVGTDLSRSLCDDYGHQVEDNHLISSPDGKTTTDSNDFFK